MELLLFGIFGNTYYINIFFTSIANLKCTHPDRQMYH